MTLIWHIRKIHISKPNHAFIFCPVVFSIGHSCIWLLNYQSSIQSTNPPLLKKFHTTPRVPHCEARPFSLRTSIRTFKCRSKERERKGRERWVKSQWKPILPTSASFPRFYGRPSWRSPQSPSHTKPTRPEKLREVWQWHHYTEKCGYSDTVGTG